MLRMVAAPGPEQPRYLGDLLEGPLRRLKGTKSSASSASSERSDASPPLSRTSSKNIFRPMLGRKPSSGSSSSSS
ncbi:hypothetical protein PG993_013134 [Apiospora rasikravindrae]|uniref:Uncharacterized protein n=1 Tax=Apiospora rasikravindrae TaxID=990691 RepID=A0ABR1RWS4_9PEZI